MGVLTKPPVWFWVVGAVLLVWGLVGVAGFVIDRTMDPSTIATMSEYDKRMHDARPTWSIVAYGIGTITGLFGTLGLLVRRRDALVWYVVSLIAVVVLFGWVLGLTDIIAVKGFATAAGLPIVIFVLCIGEIALARHARARGWIG